MTGIKIAFGTLLALVALAALAVAQSDPPADGAQVSAYSEQIEREIWILRVVAAGLFTNAVVFGGIFLRITWWAATLTTAVRANSEAIGRISGES